MHCVSGWRRRVHERGGAAPTHSGGHAPGRTRDGTAGWHAPRVHQDTVVEHSALDWVGGATPAAASRYARAIVNIAAMTRLRALGGMRHRSIGATWRYATLEEVAADFDSRGILVELVH